MSSEQARTRSVTWEDPLASAAAGRELPGIEYLRRAAAGELSPPPFALLLGMQWESVGDGVAVFTVTPAEYHYNPIGVVHGGYAMTLLDSAMGCAVQSTLAAGEGYTSLETSVNFVRPITLETGRVRCEGKVLHRGGRVATAEGRLIAENTGKLLAHGTTTCLVMRP